MVDWTIRNAESNDALGIAKVHVLTWQTAYKGLIPDSYLQALSIDKRTESWAQQLNTLADGTGYLVAESAGEIIGFATVGKGGDDDSSKDNGELYAIYVHPDRQGIGIGNSLHQAGIDFLKSEYFKTATLWVLEANHASRRWYESRGWQIEGALKVEDRGSFQLHEIRYLLDLNN